MLKSGIVLLIKFEDLPGIPARSQSKQKKTFQFILWFIFGRYIGYMSNKRSANLLRWSLKNMHFETPDSTYYSRFSVRTSASFTSWETVRYRVFRPTNVLIALLYLFLCISCHEPSLHVGWRGDKTSSQGTFKKVRMRWVLKPGMVPTTEFLSIFQITEGKGQLSYSRTHLVIASLHFRVTKRDIGWISQIRCGSCYLFQYKFWTLDVFDCWR